MSVRSYALIAVIIGFFSFAIFHSLRDIRSGQSTAVEVTALNYWNASQARFELERTIAALDAYAGGVGDVTRDDLINRVDIFWSRLPILYEGEQGESLAEVTSSDVIAPKIMKRVDEMNADILFLEPHDRETYNNLREAFVSFEEPLQGILLQVHHVYDSGYFTLHKKMEHLYNRHKAYLIGTLVSGTILIVFLMRSIRKAKLAGNAAHDARVELETVINALPLSVDAVDKDGRLVLLNDHARAHLGIDAEVWVGRRPSEIGLGQTNDHLNQEVLATGEPVQSTEIAVNRDNETTKQTWLTSKVPVRDRDANVRKVITVGVDITDRKRAEARIQHLAHHDVLTGLHNRAFFQERLVTALAALGAGAKLALLYIDFDRFKDVNDRLGHEAGDQFLVEASRRLSKSLPPTASISRLGGDEFAIIQEGIRITDDARRIADRLIAAFDEPIDVGGERWLATISVGISLATRNEKTPEHLLREADLALYDAKARGGNMLCFFTSEMSERQRPHYGIQQGLRSAIAKDDLVLHYQPKIRLRDLTLSGCEALLRWNHPEQGPVPPSVFIPAAENCDLIMSLGQMVLKAACAQIAQWRQEGKKPLPVAINMSAAQFMRQDVAAMIRQALNEYGVLPQLLEVEVTETTLMDNSDSVLSTLRTLRAMDIGLTLDDFGTGYSSLSYLQRFPIDKIKIDKTFVQPIASAQGDPAIVRAILAMAHSLGITVIAEGVETKAQCDLLATMGCDEIQGYLIGPARPPEDLFRWRDFGAGKRLITSPSDKRCDVITL